MNADRGDRSQDGEQTQAKLEGYRQRLISMLVSAKDLERQQIRLSRNEMLFSKGDPCDGLYLLEAGTMDVEIPREQGPSLTINRLHAVNLLGELSLFGDLERTATCRCGSSKAVLWKYDNTTALARIDQERDLRLGFMHHLSLICANTLQYAEELGELAHQASQGKAQQVRQRLKADVASTTRRSPAKRAFLTLLDAVHDREQELINKVHFLELQLIRDRAKTEADLMAEHANFETMKNRAQAMRSRRPQGNVET